MSDVRGGGTSALAGGALYSEVQCIMGNGHMWNPPLVNRQRDTTENITFPQPSLAGGKNSTLKMLPTFYSVLPNLFKLAGQPDAEELTSLTENLSMRSSLFVVLVVRTPEGH